MRSQIWQGLVAVGLVASTAAHAAIVNGGFESGDLTGWTASLSNGAATVVTSNTTTYFTTATYLPAEGNYFLAIQSGDANVWQTVSQTVTLAAGDVLSGSAAFDWGDYLPFADGARVRILDATGVEIAAPFYLDGTLTPGTQKAFGEPDSGYNGPWTNWSWTAAAAGTFTLEYAARNTLDGGGPNQTFGYFDAYQVNVPEPATLALLGLGLAGMGVMRRRKLAA